VSEERGTTFGVGLRRLREAAGLTQEELAARAGLAAKGVGALERGERKHPYPHTVRVLADALGLEGAERDAFVRGAPKRTGMAFTPTVGDAQSTAPPTPPTPLVGREREFATVGSLLEADAARLVTLTGPGGVGKTRLALEVTGSIRGRFPEGVAFVALAPIADPALVVPSIAQSLGLREAGGRSPHETVRAYLRDRRLLLVLDNLEHLLGAAPDVAELLAACPSLKVLATSRAPLRVRGEQEYPLEPLPVPDLSRVPSVGDVEEVPSVRLLVERASEASPGFGLTQANAAALAAICRRLDGLPLALELVAARLRLLPPTALLARLDSALPLLSNGPRDLPERQRTIRDTVAWSHDLLSPGEQTLFRRLSVFVGGFELPAAEAVSGDDSVLDGLYALLENSLVRPGTGSADAAEPRFSMLETIRAYGLERLAASGEEEEVRGRHAGYYLALAERAYPELEGGEQASWLERLGREHDNLRAALSWLLERGEPERAARLASSTWLFWAVRGYAGEGQMWLERALASGKLAGSARADALAAISLLLFAKGEIGRMSEVIEEAIAEARAAGDEQTLALAIVQRGYAATFRGDLDAAEEALSEGLAMAGGRGGHWGTALVQNALGQVALSRGDFGRATELLRESEAALRETEDAFALATNLNIQATISQLQGDDGRTEALLRESVGLSAALRDTWALDYGLVGLAGVRARRGDPERAARLFGAAEALREKTGAVPSFPPTRALYERDLKSVRGKIHPETFEAAWNEGRAMTLDRVIAEALEEPSS
jgi:predicted ATPase/DNA-binding XRE family transcriptional regulator